MDVGGQPAIAVERAATFVGGERGDERGAADVGRVARDR